MASNSKLRKYLTVYVHYNGLFAPKPLLYLNAVVVSISDVDFGAMDLKEFKLFVTKMIEGSCDNANMELLEDDEGYYSEPDVDDDKDSQLSDDIPYEHKADGYIPSLDKTVGDEFLHPVSGISKDKNDEVETNNGDDKPVYPIHNENKKWDKMVPILGIRFSNPMKLKFYLTNYAVKNEYNLYYEKNDSQRRYALDEIEGSLIEHYGKVWSYGEEIMRINLGSTVKIDVNVMPDSTTYFSKMYVCFKGVKDGWITACRRVIGAYGCFLKGICKGQLLAAMGRDVNNHIFPIAWAMVAVEIKETWKWFLDLLLLNLKLRQK
ncbi:unnamed protein product [Lactuca saligna]|uniref:Uncharacterized protein n=1 Tax=Lactuca saligna TaxID=75948 RepID=A0AA35YUK6_LACSI|nr:unnamed protein product [Lactuca saligna]